MNEIVRDQPIRYAQADANKVKAEKPAVSKEVKQNPEQKQFYDRWQKETAQAYQSEKIANQQARDRLKGLTASELRKVGAKQLLWGWGLSFINVCSAGIGGVGGFFGTAAAIAAVAGSASVAPFIGGAVIGTAGLVGGAVLGAEIVRSIYEKVVRKFDNSLPTLDKNDRALGDALSVVAGWNPPMVAGARNIFEGYNQMKSIQ